MNIGSILELECLDENDKPHKESRAIWYGYCCGVSSDSLLIKTYSPGSDQWLGGSYLKSHNVTTFSGPETKFKIKSEKIVCHPSGFCHRINKIF